MSKIKCIIIEDEPLAARVLGEYVSAVPFLTLIGSFKDAILAASFLLDHKVDLIFLDLHLPKLKGMDFLRTLANRPAVIVTTAYHQYAVEGFELNVTDYLLKPIEFDRFLAAVNKVNIAGKDNDAIFVSVQKRKVKILFHEILYIESQREYIKIVTTQRQYLSKMGTGEIEELLPALLFKRIHRSFIVAVQQINAYTADMVEIKGISIPIGRGYKDVINNL